MPRRKLVLAAALARSSTVALAARGSDDKSEALGVIGSLTVTGLIDLSPSASNKCSASGSGLCDVETDSCFEIADTAWQTLAIGTLGARRSVGTVREGC
jgi:hypothetical protein